jgi:hypothetical protein
MRALAICPSCKNGILVTLCSCTASRPAYKRHDLKRDPSKDCDHLPMSEGNALPLTMTMTSDERCAVKTKDQGCRRKTPPCRLRCLPHAAVSAMSETCTAWADGIRRACVCKLKLVWLVM